MHEKLRWKIIELYSDESKLSGVTLTECMGLCDILEESHLFMAKLNRELIAKLKKFGYTFEPTSGEWTKFLREGDAIVKSRAGRDPAA